LLKRRQRCGCGRQPLGCLRARLAATPFAPEESGSKHTEGCMMPILKLGPAMTSQPDRIRSREASAPQFPFNPRCRPSHPAALSATCPSAAECAARHAATITARSRGQSFERSNIDSRAIRKTNPAPSWAESWMRQVRARRCPPRNRPDSHPADRLTAHRSDPTSPHGQTNGDTRAALWSGGGARPILLRASRALCRPAIGPSFF